MRCAFFVCQKNLNIRLTNLKINGIIVITKIKEDMLMKRLNVEKFLSDMKVDKQPMAVQYIACKMLQLVVCEPSNKYVPGCIDPDELEALESVCYTNEVLGWLNQLDDTGVIRGMLKLSDYCGNEVSALAVEHFPADSPLVEGYKSIFLWLEDNFVEE